MTNLLILFLFIRLLVNFYSWLFDEPEEAEQPPEPEPDWFDLERVLEVFYPQFPAFADAGGREFLRALFRPLVGNRELLHRLNGHTTLQDLTGHTLEAIYYWLPRAALRPLDRWAPPYQFRDFEIYLDALILYLFEQHPVPPVVGRLWWHRSTELPLAPNALEEHPAKALKLYFYLTRGGGLHKAPFLRWELSRSAVRYFYEAPMHFEFRQAYWFALFCAEGAPPEVLARMGIWPAGYAHAAFWRELVRLWLRNEPAMDEAPNELGLAIRQIEWLKFGVPHGAFLGYRALEASYGAEPEFSLRGRSWASLQRYLEELVGLREFPLPPGMGERQLLTDPNGVQYQMVFLGSEQALVQEGILMSHCVAEYLEQARSGESAFWSLRRLEPDGRQKRLLTVQLYQGYVEEASGLANREPTTEEWALLNNWLRQFVQRREAASAESAVC